MSNVIKSSASNSSSPTYNSRIDRGSDTSRRSSVEIPTEMMTVSTTKPNRKFQLKRSKAKRFVTPSGRD